MTNKNLVMVFISTIFLFMFLSNIIFAQGPPVQGDILPDIKLAVPQDSDDRDYLGLSKGKSFTISQIKAPVIIIEVLSMYCPYCQKSASKVNDLYRLLENNPSAKGKIKLIGIGAGNSLFEVSIYKKTYGVPFPVLPDADFSIHRALGEVRTPYFICISTENQIPRVFHAQLGSFENAEEFMNLIITLSPLQ